MSAFIPTRIYSGNGDLLDRTELDLRGDRRTFEAYLLGTLAALTPNDVWEYAISRSKAYAEAENRKAGA